MLGSIYFLFTSAKTELAPQEDQGVIITQSIAAPERHPAAAPALFARGLRHLRQASRNRARVPARRARPVDRRHGVQALGPAHQDHQRPAAGVAAGGQQGRGRPHRGVSAAAAARQHRFAGAVRASSRPSRSTASTRFAQSFLQQALQSGMFIFLDCDLKIDNPQSDITIDRDKTAQLGLKMSDVGGALASMLGGGYVNYFSIERPFLQGDSAGAAALPAQSAAVARLLYPHRRRRAGAAVDGRHVATKTVPESLNHFQQLNSATIQGVAMPGVAQGDALRLLQDLAQAHAAAGLYDRLRRPEPPIRPGEQRLRHHLRLRADHHFPGAGGFVRKLPRSAHHPGVGADVDRRRADLRHARVSAACR